MATTSVELLLKQSQNWQESLRLIVQARKENGIKINFASVARQAGIQSRSYVRMLFHGKKTPSLSSLDNILTALKISPAAKKFIILQWQTDQAIPQPAKLIQLNQQIEVLRTRLAAGAARSSRDQIYRVTDTPVVFASLGKVGEGVKLNQILEKTRISNERIRKALNVLVSEGVAEIRDGRVLPLSSQLVMKGDSTANFFRQFYQECVRNSHAKATTDFKNKENLFSGFAVSIDSAKQKQHADALYNLLVDFLADIEDPSGDRIAIINASLHNSN